MGQVSSVHFSLMTAIIQILSFAVWVFFIVAFIILVINSQKSKRSLQNIKALLEEIKQNKDDLHS